MCHSLKVNFRTMKLIYLEVQDLCLCRMLIMFILKNNKFPPPKIPNKIAQKLLDLLVEVES